MFVVMVIVVCFMVVFGRHFCAFFYQHHPTQWAFAIALVHSGVVDCAHITEECPLWDFVLGDRWLEALAIFGDGQGGGFWRRFWCGCFLCRRFG